MLHFHLFMCNRILFSFTESQQCNVTCNAWSFQREPPDPEPEEDFCCQLTQLTKHLKSIWSLSSNSHILPNAPTHVLNSFSYICYVLLFSWCCLCAIVVFMMLSHLLLTFLSTTTKRGAAVFKPAQPNGLQVYWGRSLCFLSWTRNKSEYEYTLVEEKWVNLTLALLQSSA